MATQMSKKRKFVADGVFFAYLNEVLARELAEDGYFGDVVDRSDNPINTVKSVHIAHTFNSLSYASPPSVFASPHLSSKKELKFLRRHHFFGTPRSDLSSENGLRSTTNAGILNPVPLSVCSADPPECFDTKTSTGEVTLDPTNGRLELPIELSRTLNYDCGSPECNSSPAHGIKTDPTTVISDTPAALAESVEEHSVERCLSLQNRVDLQGIHQLKKIKEEEVECDWENLISDASNLINFDSLNNKEVCSAPDQKKDNSGSSSFTSLSLTRDGTDDMQKTQPLAQDGSCGKHEMEDCSAHSRAVENEKEANQTPAIVSSTFQNNQQVKFSSEEVNAKAEKHVLFGCKQQRGIRRRCLVFDTAGGQKKKPEDDSNSSSSVSSQSGGKFLSENKQLVPMRPCSSSSPCIIPGIGLHLNSLAATTKDPRVVKHETLPSGKELISMPSSMTSLHSLPSGQKPLNTSFVMSSMRTDMGSAGNELYFMHDASRVSMFKISEDLSESSPKKKRRKGEQAGELEACKRCNCKKSKCLKLYCECFAAGVYCVEPCSCLECFNKPIHEDTVLATRKQIESRNPLAFAPKVIRNSEPAPEIGEESNKTPASARHKRGCNCKKSSCLKKYCECFQGGVGCSMNCRCESCKNKFGRKDGSIPVGTDEAEPEEEGTVACEKAGVDTSLLGNEVHKEEQYQDHALPVTFSFQFRTSIQLPFSSFGKPPRSPLPPPPKFDKHFQITSEDETPEILRGNGSPIGVVKTSSPNSKRVSPPHSEFPSSPNRKSSRKLVLQSISSFPSMTQHEDGDFQ